jgi:hypothetical protein
MSSQVLAKPSGSLHRLSLRLHVALHRPTLDAELARGADPVSDEALALRAERLGEPSTREALADTLQNLLDAAEEPPNTWHQGDPRPPLQRETVLAARGVLLALREALNRPGRVPPRAVALAHTVGVGLGKPRLRGRLRDQRGRVRSDRPPAAERRPLQARRGDARTLNGHIRPGGPMKATWSNSLRRQANCCQRCAGLARSFRREGS